jgi:hypothetical protein
MERCRMFNIHMKLEFDGQVFNLSLNRIENGVIYFHIEDVGVQIQRESQRSGLVEAEGGQLEETQTLSPGAEEGVEAVTSQGTIARVPTEGPGGPEGEGVEPPPPQRKRGTRSTRGQR